MYWGNKKIKTLEIFKKEKKKKKKKKDEVTL